MTIDEPIATRELEQNGHPVRVEVFAPVPNQWNQWNCRYRIIGLTELPEIDNQAHGADAVQALLLAFDHIGDHVALHDNLTYRGGPDLGFPVSEPTGRKMGRATGHTGR